MALPIPRLHLLEIDDQSWYALRTSTTKEKLITQLQVPLPSPRLRPKLPHLPLETPRPDPTTHLPSLPSRPNTPNRPRQDPPILHFRRLLLRRRRPHTLH